MPITPGGLYKKMTVTDVLRFYAELEGVPPLHAGNRRVAQADGPSGLGGQAG